MSKPSGEFTPMARLGIVALVLVGALIVGAVLWALPAWFWMFVVGVAVGVVGERRRAHRRRARRRRKRFPNNPPGV
jgi:Flp pilus assembly protein TadB